MNDYTFVDDAPKGVMFGAGGGGVKLKMSTRTKYGKKGGGGRAKAQKFRMMNELSTNVSNRRKTVKVSRKPKRKLKTK